MNELYALIIFIVATWLCVMTSIYRHKWFTFFKNGKVKDVLIDLMLWDSRLKNNKKARIKKCIKLCMLGLLSLLPEILMLIITWYMFSNIPIARVFAYYILASAFIFEYYTTCADSEQDGTYVCQTEKRPLYVWLIALWITTVITLIFSAMFMGIAENWVETKIDESEKVFEIVSVECKKYYDANGEEKELYEISYQDEEGNLAVVSVDTDAIDVAISNDDNYFSEKTIYRYEKKLAYNDSQFEVVSEEVNYTLYLNETP